jgi:Tfp pilus assembly protein PilX
MANNAEQVRRSRNRRGFALMMVIAVVALAAFLGYAMLASSTLQSRASSNQIKLVSADYLAESGLNVGMYYLQKPENAPSLNGDGYWSGMSQSYTLPNGQPATLDVSVTRDASDQWTYEVVSTAQVGQSSSSRVSKSTGARIYVRNEYVLKHAAAFNNTVSINGPFTITGDVYTTKTLGLKIGAQTPYVSGAGYCKTASTGVGFTSPGGGWKTMASPAQVAPSNTELNLYKTYDIDQVTYNCATISSTSLTGVSGVVTKAPTAANPAGVFYHNGSSGGAFVLNDNVTINGTLVVEGDCQINGANITITPQAGYPALIVTGTLEVVQPSKSATAHGVVYVGTALKQTGSATILTQSNLTVNGGLILGTTAATPVPASFTIKVNATYNATKAKAPELSSVARVPKGVSILRWGLP